MAVAGDRRFLSPWGLAPGQGRERVVLAKKRSKNHRPHESSAPGALDRPADAVPRPVAAPPPAAPVQESDEVRLLREALQAERSARAALELRLRSLEDELHVARRPRATPTSAVLSPEDLGIAALHELAAPAKPSADDRAFFESWVIEANMRADAELAAHAAPSAPSLIPVLAEGRPSVAETSVAQDRLLRKLTSAREALDTAEAKAAHNAAQVKKLTTELAAARAEHMRTSTRLRTLEARLAQAEGQPLAPSAAPPAERVPETALDAASATVASGHPFADLQALPPLHPPTAASTIDVEDALAAWGAGPAETPAVPGSTPDDVAQDFDLLLQDAPGAKSDLGEALAQWGAEVTAEPAPGLEDALAAWGAPPESAAAQDAAVPDLEDALAAWGASDKAAPAADPAAAGLEDALAAWGSLGEAIPTPPERRAMADTAPSFDAPNAPVDSLPQLDFEDTPEEPEEEPAVPVTAARGDEITVELPAQAPPASDIEFLNEIKAEDLRVEDAPVLASPEGAHALALPEEALPATDIEFLNEINAEDTPVDSGQILEQETTEPGFVLAVTMEDLPSEEIEFVEETPAEVATAEDATAEDAVETMESELIAEHRANADTVRMDTIPEALVAPELEAASIDFLDVVRDMHAPAASDRADNVLDLDEAMPEGAGDIAFDTPAEEQAAAPAPQELETEVPLHAESAPHALTAEEDASALEEALAAVFGAPEEEFPEIESATAIEAGAAVLDDIEEIPADEPGPTDPPLPELPDEPAVPETPAAPELPEAPESPAAPEAPSSPAVPEAPVAPGAPPEPELPATPEEVTDEDDFEPEGDARSGHVLPQDAEYDTLTTAYQRHHKDDEREALLARPTRIMEAGRQHGAPRRQSVAASLESWSGIGNPPVRRAPAQVVEPMAAEVEEQALEPAEDAGGKATMVDALLRFMRPK